jgi:hypothetical protein
MSGIGIGIKHPRRIRLIELRTKEKMCGNRLREIVRWTLGEVEKEKESHIKVILKKNK